MGFKAGYPLATSQGFRSPLAVLNILISLETCFLPSGMLRDRPSTHSEISLEKVGELNCLIPQILIYDLKSSIYDTPTSEHQILIYEVEKSMYDTP